MADKGKRWAYMRMWMTSGRLGRTHPCVMRWKALGNRTLTKVRTNRNRCYTHSLTLESAKKPIGTTHARHMWLCKAIRLSYCLQLGAIREVLRPFRHQELVINSSTTQEASVTPRTVVTEKR